VPAQGAEAAQQTRERHTPRHTPKTFVRESERERQLLDEREENGASATDESSRGGGVRAA
jgi:hypothetical protein